MNLALYALLAVLGLGAIAPKFNPLAIFQKKPETAQLAQAQAELAKAKQDAADAQRALLAAQQAEQAKKQDQLTHAQQMAAGASEALKSATPEPPVKLAIALLDRTGNGLAAAIGSLPADKQAEVVKIVADALSGVQARLDESNAALAAKDKALAVATTERDSLKQQIPVLQTKLDQREIVVTQQAAVVANKTQAVVTYAEKAAAKEREAGSLGALVKTLEWGLAAVVIGGIIFLVVKDVVLPSLAAEFPANKLVTGAYRIATSLTSSHTVTLPPKQ